MWARMTVCQELAVNSAATFDLARATSLIEEAQLALADATTIKTGHTQAEKAIDRARAATDRLVGKVREALENLSGELTSNGESE